MRRLIASKLKISWVNIPVFGTYGHLIYVSTRLQNIKVNDDVAPRVTPKNNDYTIVANESPYSGTVGGGIVNEPTNIRYGFLGGVSDVFSLRLRGTFAEATNFNILDIESFLSQFPNLYSISIDSNSTSGRTQIINGDLAKIHDNLEKIKIKNIQNPINNTNLYLNLSNFSTSSKLKFFSAIENNQPFKVNGDLSKLPISCNYFKIFTAETSSGITYTQGKTWANTFDTLYLNVPMNSLTETDNLLIDFDNSVSVSTGNKAVYLPECFRSSLSDSALASIISKGFTVTLAGQTTTSVLGNIRYIRDTLGGVGLNTFAEIEVYSEGVNVALGKNVAMYRNGVFILNTSTVTNGNKGDFYNGGGGVMFAFLDLGDVYNVDLITIIHYFDGRRLNAKLEVSEDGVIWRTLFDYAVSGTYPEVPRGKKYFSN